MVVEKLKPDNFYREDNKSIFEAMLNLYNKSEPVDLITVKEAEMIVSNYLSKVENEKQIKSHSMRQIENKYKRMKKINIILGILLAVNIILQII